MSIHPALISRPIFDGTVKGGAGPLRALVEGGLRYRDASGNEQSAWIGGYYGENRTKDPAAPADKKWQIIDREKGRAFARSITAPLFALNVEQYPADGLGRLIDVLELIRSERPDVALAVWGVLPESNWWLFNNYAQAVDYRDSRPHPSAPPQSPGWWATTLQQQTRALEAWRVEARLRAAKLLPHVDVVIPVIYPVFDADDANAWYAARGSGFAVGETVKLAGGKPVYPCFWPYASDPKVKTSDALNRAVLAASFEAGADGFIVWADQSHSVTAAKSVYESFVKQASQHSPAVAVKPVE